MMRPTCIASYAYKPLKKPVTVDRGKLKPLSLLSLTPLHVKLAVYPAPACLLIVLALRSL